STWIKLVRGSLEVLAVAETFITGFCTLGLSMETVIHLCPMASPRDDAVMGQPVVLRLMVTCTCFPVESSWIGAPGFFEPRLPMFTLPVRVVPVLLGAMPSVMRPVP